MIANTAQLNSSSSWANFKGENMHLIFQKIIISSVSEESPLFLAFILVIIININYHSLIDSEATIIIDNNKPLV